MSELNNLLGVKKKSIFSKNEFKVAEAPRIEE
jgi:hypothetical protein